MTLRLMAIHAHPDDESSKGAATMAKYAAEGHRVRVVTMTGGERGDVLNPRLKEREAEIMADIAAVRREEMAKAAEALGVEHTWMGYVDSGLPEGDPLPPLPEGSFALEELAAVGEKLVGEIREFRPHVIITYDENGGYPHPDHLMVHAVSMFAWEKAGDPDFGVGEPWTPLKLYYTHGFVRSRMEKLHNHFVEGGQVSPLAAIVERMQDRPDIFERVTTQVEAADYFGHRDQALLAHATQIDPDGFFFAVPTKVQQEVWPWEDFELAQTRVPVTLPEHDLFDGIPADTN